MEAQVKKTFDPLNDTISSVTLIDSMGDDLRVVNAARVSMAKESKLVRGELSDRDVKLLKYLARNNHWTPFSHVMITLRIKMPIFVARQWYKHQVGFTRNEVSRRYVDDTPEFYLPKEWRERAANVKQGSSDYVFQNSDVLSDTVRDTVYASGLSLYEKLIKVGVAPEQARMVLPQSMYTEFYETASLASYARLCGLRMDAHAQNETRQYAFAVSEIVRDIAPVSWAVLITKE